MNSKRIDPVSTEYSEYDVNELLRKIASKIKALDEGIGGTFSGWESILVWIQKKNVLVAAQAYLSGEDVDLEEIADQNPRYKDDWSWKKRKWYAGSHGDTVALLNAVKKIKPAASKSLVVVTTDCAPVVSCMNANALFHLKLPLDIFTSAIPSVAGMTYNDTTTFMGTLSNTCRQFHTFFEKPLTDRALILLWQAVIDDKREQVKKILDARPDLLLIDPPEDFVIESKCTWQRMYAENPLVMAAKRRQIKMIELLLPYYGKLTQTDAVMNAKTKGLSAWVHYEIVKDNRGHDEIFIPEEYVKYAKDMLDVFCEETFPHGVPGNNDIPINVELSETTEEALKQLFNALLPECAVRLDNYFDVELLLLAVYKAYRDHFRQLQSWDQRDAFCVRVIGLIQGVQSPEIAKIFCTGLDELSLNGVLIALKEGREIKLSRNACKHKLKGGEAYYRIRRDSFTGLGFNFFCGIRGGGSMADARSAYMEQSQVSCAEKVMLSKNSKFLECYAASVSTATPIPFRS
jgi:hypothetical protein